MRKFCVELLHFSPSPVLHCCYPLAVVYPRLGRLIFRTSFTAAWVELDEPHQDYLVRALETVLRSHSAPPDILLELLNLAEHMEHDESDLHLHLDIRNLGEVATWCRAFAKALHYKELEFQTNPASCTEALITINEELEQPEAAIGVIEHARCHFASAVTVKESWYETLARWDKALNVYEGKLRLIDRDPSDENWVKSITGKMRCLDALGEWGRLRECVQSVWGLCEAAHNETPTGEGAWRGRQPDHKVDEHFAPGSAMLGSSIGSSHKRLLSADVHHCVPFVIPVCCADVYSLGKT